MGAEAVATWAGACSFQGPAKNVRPARTHRLAELQRSVSDLDREDLSADFLIGQFRIIGSSPVGMAPKKKVAAKKGGGKASPEEMRAAFAVFDVDGNGTISRAEFVAIMTRTGGEKALSDEAASKAFDAMDANADGSLSYEEFVSAWSKGDGASKQLSAAKTEEEALRARVVDEWEHVFEGADKGGKGHLTKGEVAGVIRQAEERFAWLDDGTRGPFVKAAYAECFPADDGGVSKVNFCVWYDRFESFHRGLIKAEAEADEAAKAAAAAEREALFASDGTWKITLDALDSAVQRAWAKRRVPLLIDATADGDGFTPLETFYSYSGHQLVELKKMVRARQRPSAPAPRRARPAPARIGRGGACSPPPPCRWWR